MYVQVLGLTLIFGLVIGKPTETPIFKDLEHYKLLRHYGPLDEKALDIDFSKIGTLEIRLSTIKELSKDILRRFSNLENLTISYSHMGKAEKNVFENCCPKLKNLDIDHWLEFEEDDLRGIGTLPLERLEIINQDIPVLKSGILQGRNLKTLSLIGNNIREIEDGAFSNIENLEYLLLSNNKLKALPKAALAPLKKLETLELVSNGIEKISTENIPELPSLTDIVLIKEDLKELNLEGVHKVAPKLVDVFVIGNKNTHIPENNGKLKIHNWL